jgi:hypothetical protein
MDITAGLALCTYTDNVLNKKGIIMITKTWNITGLGVRPTLLGFTNVVSVVNWNFSVTAYDRTSTTFGTVQLSEPGAEFIDASNLTQDQIIAWVKSSLGNDAVSQLDSRVTNQALNLSMPTISSIPLPWETTTSTNETTMI